MKVSISLVENLARCKSPVVAVPIPGTVPLCLNRSRLVAWLKGVRLCSAHIETHSAKRTRSPYGKPVCVVVRSLVLNGTTAYSKATCRMYEWDRAPAVAKTKAWAASARLRSGSKQSRETSRALKVAEYEGGDTEVTVALTDGATVKVRGTSVELPRLVSRFVVHRSLGKDGRETEGWTVTEVSTGMAAGFGKTPLAAIKDATSRLLKLTPEQLATAAAKIAAKKGQINV